MVAREQPKAQSRAKGGGNYFTMPNDNIDFFHSGSKMLDLALGGGWAERRVINIVGDKSTGKTLLCIEAAANFARKYPKGRIRYREVEEAFERGYAAAVGMPIDRVDFGDEDADFETVEDLFEELEHRAKNAEHEELFIVDSLDALSSRAEVGRDIGEGTYGQEKAKLMSQLFRRLIRAMGRRNITLMIVSQTRDRIGATFGKKWTRTGGRALDFYASQVVYLAQLQRIWRNLGTVKRPTGVQIKAMLDKNKVGLPFRECTFDIKFAYGIDDFKSCMDWLKSVKRENDVLGGMKLASFMDYAKGLDNADYNKLMKNQVHRAVEDNWYRIETSFLPTRAKYGER